MQLTKQSLEIMSKPLILISNDDGINSPGLHRLIDYVSPLADIVVSAPDGPCSGKSAALTVNGPIRIIEHPDYNGAKMRSVTGTPVDCVKIAIHNIIDRRPDLVLSGINHGSNAGNSIIYSGTMGAAMEACMIGIPAIGYSLLSHALDADFSETEPYIVQITKAVLEKGLPKDVCLNVNFPAKCKIEGMKVVRAADSHWTEEYQKYVDPNGKPFYWLSGKIVNEEPDNPETDLYWLDKGYATVVPACSNRNAISAIQVLKEIL